MADDGGEAIESSGNRATVRLNAQADRRGELDFRWDDSTPIDEGR